ncbi:O-antigen ligase [Bradyrhizobium lablabi]|uniref:O-antigen ligase n=1 Tax=Bradyrhizobium lablabi TaxID=722472 RepID=A0A1M6MQB6_9BRAD|nr:O-antigen ligase family protein [Bradyrhizobium lablabi]SHJ85483.1 O-antigen ligase [Bradyrhizobium lablabi]
MWNLILGLLLVRATLDSFLGDFRVEVAGIDFSPGVILNVLVLALFATLVYKNSSRAMFPSLVWGPFLLLVAISIAHTPDKIGALKLYGAQLTYFAFFSFPFLLPNTSTRNDSIADVLLMSSIAPFAFGVYELATGFNGDFRAQSTFPHSNIFAFYLLILISGILYKFYNQRVRQSVGASSVYVGLLLIAVAYLLLTQTRSAWIAFAAMFGVAALFLDRRLLLATLLVPTLLSVPAVQNRLTDVSSSNDLAAGEQQSSYAWRQLLWEQAFDDLEGSAAFGKGLGSFHINSATFSDSAVLEEGTTEAHSAYVQTIYENGWTGLAAYLFIYAACIVTLVKLRRFAQQEAIIGIVAIVGMLIVNYSDNTPYYLSYNWYAWSFVAFIICKCRSIQAMHLATKPQFFAQGVGNRSNLQQLRT